MELPPELLSNVAQHLPRKDLKHLRLTCRRLAEHVIPFLFNSVFLSFDPLDLELAELALIYYPRQIRSVVVSLLPFEELTDKQYRDGVRLVRNREFDRLPQRYRFKKHMTLGYEECERLQQRRTQPNPMSKMQELFQMALTVVPNIRALVITHRHRFNETDLAAYCPFETCPMSPEQHELFRPTCWETNQGRPSQDISGFLFSTAASGLVANLVKLRVDLDHLCSPASNIAQSKYVATFLSQAHNLECLFLQTFSAISRSAERYARHYYIPGARHRLSCFLNRYQLPRLRVLILNKGELFRDELLTCLKNLPGLRHLIIEQCLLRGYLWQDLIEKIRMQYHLESLGLSHLMGGFYMNPPWASPYMDYCDEVQRYLLDGEPNPFCREELDKEFEKKKKYKASGGPINPKIAERCYERHF